MSGGDRGGTFFVWEVPDYKSAMLICIMIMLLYYTFNYSKFKILYLKPLVTADVAFYDEWAYIKVYRKTRCAHSYVNNQGHLHDDVTRCV